MWLLPEEAEAEGAALVSSCDIFELAKEQRSRRRLRVFSVQGAPPAT